MRALKRLTTLTLAASFALAAACSDSSGPDSVNPSALAGSATTAAATFNNNAAFQSMATLSGLFPQYAAVAALRGTLPSAPALRGPEALKLAQSRRVQALRLFASLNNPQALFPANVLGKTLEWDATSHFYVAGNLSGAPGNGIRILLYSVNPVTGEPTLPLQALGHVDLTDESTPSADNLGVLLTLGNTTIADYTISLVVGTTVTNAEAQGFIRDAQGGNQVTFDFTDVVNNLTQSYTSTSEITGADGAAIFVQVALTSTTIGLTIRVQHGGNRIEMAVTVSDTDGSLTGTVKYNGTQVATVGGDVGAPVFTAVSGRTLSAEETVSLISIFSTALDLATDLGGAVFAPGVVVFAGQ